MSTIQRSLAGWGNYPRQDCALRRPERYAGLRPEGEGSHIARGMGRSYGDAALNEQGTVILTERLQRLRSFDRESGVLRAEAGMTLDDLLRICVPAGWFPAVTPGTRFVSLGGCVAADVHGKNHHRDGSFSTGVRELALIDGEGQQRHCSRDEQAEAFWATVGGMGLTGMIGEVALQLQPIDSAYMHVRHLPSLDLAHTFSLLEDPAHDATYTVAWLDLVARGHRRGRGVVMLGEHAGLDALNSAQAAAPFAAASQRQRPVPFNMPGWLLNPLSIRAFNQLYYSSQGRKQNGFISHYQPFFYPLDGLANWNRLYGSKGFLQYQCVLPTEGALAGVQALLERLQQSGQPSFLGVLKRLGDEGEGMLSFPMPGYTLAMDLPFAGTGLLSLLDELDAIVMHHGGRVYLAKDARLPPDALRRMYPRLGEWQAVRQRLDPRGCFQSSLSRRLKMEEGL